MTKNGSLLKIRNFKGTPREKCPYSKFFLSVFQVFLVRIPSFSCPYSVKIREHVDQKTYEYGHFHAVILIQNFSNLENSTLQLITHNKTVFPGDGATKEMLKTDVRS